MSYIHNTDIYGQSGYVIGHIDPDTDAEIEHISQRSRSDTTKSKFASMDEWMPTDNFTDNDDQDWSRDMLFLSQDTFGRSPSPEIGNIIANRISLLDVPSMKPVTRSNDSATLTSSQYSAGYLSGVLSLVFGDQESSHEQAPLSHTGHFASSNRLSGDHLDITRTEHQRVSSVKKKTTRDMIYDSLVAAIGEGTIENIIAESNSSKSRGENWGP